MHTKKITITLLLLLIIIIGSGISVAASPDASGLLRNWFQNKSDEATEKINEEVDEVLEKQTDRLKEELKPVIDSAEAEIDSYTQTEKQQTKTELREYADNMIKDAKASKSKINEEDYKQQLEAIVDKAISQMDNIEPTIRTNSDKGPQSDNDAAPDKSQKEDQTDQSTDSDNEDKQKSMQK